jgi:hypothetical protein
MFDILPRPMYTGSVQVQGIYHDRDYLHPTT